MVKQIFSNFTWLDIGVGILIIRGCWIGFRRGLFVEILKNISALVAIFVGFHYYIRCANALIHFVRFLEPAAYFLSYIFLVGITLLVFHLAQEGLIVMFRDKDKDGSFPSRIIGLILGFWRSLLVGGLIFFGCLVIGHSGLTSSVRRSFTSPALLSLDTQVYAGIYQGVVQPLFSQEKKNMRVFTLVEANKRVFD